MCFSAEFLVQFEENHWEPGRWQDLSTYPGDLNSVILQLVPFVNYQFRVIAINSVGQSLPSRPSPRYKTSGACKQVLSFLKHSNPGNDVFMLKLLILDK